MSADGISGQRLLIFPILLVVGLYAIYLGLDQGAGIMLDAGLVMFLIGLIGVVYLVLTSGVIGWVRELRGGITGEEDP